MTRAATEVYVTVLFLQGFSIWELKKTPLPKTDSEKKKTAINISYLMKKSHGLAIGTRRDFFPTIFG